MKKVDFYSLSRPVQERFIASTRGIGLPPAILHVPFSQVGVLLWIAVASLLAIAALVVSRLGIGDIDSPLALHRTPMMAVYGGLIAGSALAIVRAITRLRDAKALPFAPGRYVFPASVVVATSHKLKVYSMADLVSMDRSPTPVSTFHFTFPGGVKLSFPVADLDGADLAERTLAVARDQVARALVDEGPRLADLDPLYDGALSSPLGPTAPLKRVVPMWAKMGWAIALIAGVVIAPIAWLARNASSDDRIFALAHAADDVASYKKYLAHGGKSSDKVSQELLPRAELRDAERIGTVQAIQEFERTHPDAKISADVAAAMRKALLVELEKAKAPRTVTALAAFAKTYPDHKLDAELKTARHALYVSALAEYKKKTTDKDALAGMERVIAFAELHGPAAEIRFRLRPSKSMEKAEVALEKSRYFGGKDTLPSKFFDSAHLNPQADRIGKALVAKFAQAFPADILSVQLGAPLDNEAHAVKVPTILVEYGVEWSNVQIVSVKPKAAFAGVNVPVDGSLIVPDGGQPVKFRQNFWRPGPEPWRFKDQPLGTFEAKVYETLTDSMFEQVEKRVLAAYFDPPPPAKK